MSNKYQQYIDAQYQYCQDNKTLVWIMHDGQCFSCYRNVFECERTRSLAHKKVITGCPHCHRSFCD